MTPCPGPGPDEFGRIYWQDAVTLASCMEEIKTPLRKDFNTKAEAEAFVEEAKKEHDLKDFEIKKEVYINE